LSLISGGSRWGNGGDYLGLTVDSTDAFHPYWADARTGTYQLWTARVRVERPPAPRKPSPIDELLPPEPPPPVLDRPSGAPVDASRRVELVFDPTSYDASRGELDLRVRLKNVSTDSLFAPLIVEVKDFGSGMGTEDREYAPTILNASNGKPGTGATRTAVTGRRWLRDRQDARRPAELVPFDPPSRGDGPGTRVDPHVEPVNAGGHRQPHLPRTPCRPSPRAARAARGSARRGAE
jgi:hypothetical protein